MQFFILLVVNNFVKLGYMRVVEVLLDVNLAEQVKLSARIFTHFGFLQLFNCIAAEIFVFLGKHHLGVGTLTNVRHPGVLVPSRLPFKVDSLNAVLCFFESHL